MQAENNTGSRREYEKPALRIIELAAEEVLGVGCKTTPVDAGGVAGNGCISGICAFTTGT